MFHAIHSLFGNSRSGYGISFSFTEPFAGLKLIGLWRIAAEIRDGSSGFIQVKHLELGIVGCLVNRLDQGAGLLHPLFDGQVLREKICR
jgi:hypothetical protein